jgi:hypothetical protein
VFEDVIYVLKTSRWVKYIAEPIIVNEKLDDYDPPS